MGPKGDHLLRPACTGNGGNHIVGDPLHQVVFQHQPGLAGPPLHHVEGVQHPGVHHGHIAKGPQGPPQLPGGKIRALPVVPQAALHGDNPRHAGLHQPAELGHPQKAVDQHNLPLGLAEVHLIAVFHIEEVRRKPALVGVFGALIARNRVLLLVGLQNFQGGGLNLRRLDFEAFQLGLHAYALAPGL